jgi:hypothetical protein
MSPGSPTIPVMVIVIVPELNDGGFEGGVTPADPAESAVPQSKISAKSEAKHRKRSVLMAVQTIPQIPLDNHNPLYYTFSCGILQVATDSFS